MRTLDVLLLADPDEHDRVRPLAGALRRAGHRVSDPDSAERRDPVAG